MTTRNSSNASSPSAFRSNNVISSFHVTMISDGDEMFDLWLPESTEGFFRISDRPDHRFLSIQGRDGKWIASCRKPAFFRNVPLEHSYATPLENGQLLYVDYDDRSYVLYVEKVSRDQRLFRNYSVNSNSEISIGSRVGNDIICKLPYISGRHAILKYSMQKWSVTDCGSQYGTFVNGVRTVSADLQLGDMLQFFGIRLIIGPGFFSLSSGSSDVEVTARLSKEEISLHGGYSRYQELDLPDDSDGIFNRNPRKRMEINTPPICVEGPPMSMLNNQMPLMLRMGSSVVMGGAAALAGNFVTLLSSVMFPFISAKYTEKQRQDYEHLRLTKYTEYLEAKRKEIVRAIENEKQILNKKHPPLSQLVGYTQSKEHLWERRTVDSDFLEIRLGTGTLPLRTSIEYPPHRFELETDVLEEKMYQLVEAPYQVEQVPIVLTLPSTRVCGLLGSRSDVVNYILQLAFQVSTLHSYDEVKLFFFVNPQEQAVLEQARYLPHTWDDSRSIRFFATDESESYRLGEYVSDQLENDPDGDLTKVLRTRPYFLFFALDKKLFESHEIFKQILQADNMQGVSVIAAYDNLPKDSQKIITLNSNGNHILTTMDVDGGNDVVFRMDYVNNQHLSSAMKLLMNTSLKTVAHSQEMPKMVTFLEMYGTGRIEQLNPMKRWAENNPTKSLAAPVGVGSDGSLFMLDLHEKRQGPHGLVAGMTGSGKSEFIITYILSMAINYHPDEVAFVLIDYKGGGLAGAFDNPQMGIHLPHLIGTITNLDGASIQRSLMSIESELLRRQRIFNEIKGIVNEGTMDIYAYQKLYRSGKVSQPMPHLFIISDEFAELKQQQPEFMEKLISAARIGRSLGVHLILATQKPTGVVNDQIRSNTKFRVCLRVQERSDSMDMLKRPEAAELTDTGRFYLQVGYNEYFAMGQSAWCGAPYEPQDFVPIQRDDSIEFLDNTGQVIAKSKPKPKKIDSGMKQIVAIVKYLSDLAERENIHSRPLWSEPLSSIYDLNSLVPEKSEESPGISVAIGMVDDPEKQRQFILNLDVQSWRNLLLIGNSGCGKTTLIKSILYALSKKYTSDRVNYYIIDFSGGTLGVFRNAPHCGAFLTENNEAEINRFLSMLKEMIQERKNLFRDAGVTSYDSYIESNPLPLVLVIIDNVSGFSALSNANTYYNTLHEYLKDAPSLGIKVLVSCSNMNELSMRSKQELLDRIALQLKDRYAYAEILGSRGNMMPAPFPGRGLSLQDGRLLEYQVAIPYAGQTERDRTTLISKEMLQIRVRDQECTAVKKLPVFNDEETFSAFCSDLPDGSFPLGYELKRMKKISVPFAQMYCTSVYLGNPRGTISTISNFIYAARKNNMQLALVKRKTKSIFDQNPQLLAEYPDVTLFECTDESALHLCELLIAETKQRIVFRNKFCIENDIPLETAKLPDTMKKASRYIRQNTQPLLVMVEDFCEFSSSMQSSALSTYQNIFTNGKGYNIYFTSFFYPKDKDKLGSDLLIKYYNEDALMMFFGGQFQNQGLTLLPTEYRNNTEPQKQYNRFLLRYMGNFHALVMPCGNIADDELDPDDRPIL